MGKLIRDHSVSIRSLMIITDKNILQKIEVTEIDSIASYLATSLLKHLYLHSALTIFHGFCITKQEVLGNCCYLCCRNSTFSLKSPIY